MHAGGDADGRASTSKARSPIRQRRKAKATYFEDRGIDERPFKAMGISIPESRADAAALLESVYSDRRTVFTVLLELVRRPELQVILRNKYLVFGPNSDALDTGSSARIGTTSDHASGNGNDVGEFGDLRAYLTYASPAHFGPWRILLTGRAGKDLEALRKSGSKLYDIMLQKLCDLSHGRFSLTNQKRISNNSPVDIFEARLPGDPRLVYQIDCVRETKNDSPKQVLLVYGIYDHKEVSRKPWDKYGKQQARRGSEYIDACRHRSAPRLAGNDVFEPGEFASMTASLDMVHSYMEEDDDAQSALSKAEIRELHTLLVLGRHAFLSQNFLDGLLEEDGVAQVHQLSQREREVVEHTDSCFVLGRSGTGKTTTILFKMFGIERAWEHLAHPQASRPRQIFVTRSSLLAKKVEQDFISFIKYDTMNENAPAHFVRRAQRVENIDIDALFTKESLGIWRSDIPKRYSDLQDEHFPLFVTYNELCIMIENDYKDQDDRTPQTMSDAWNRNPGYPAGPLLTFEVFKDKYWHRLPSELTGQTVPPVVFGEFVGIIKGTEDTINLPDGRLDRVIYEQRRTQHVDYAHFEAYSRIKSERGERDAADRAHDMIRALKERGLPGRKVDFLYVDEVQDNILVEISLLRSICRNPSGLFWAGDTAQTISHGSAFRFADLTAFLHRFERNQLALQGPALPNPAFFHLSINYRSPGGVVNCARSVVDLLKHFPRAIDNLEREEGIIQGLRPIFLQRKSDGIAQSFFTLDKDSGRARAKLGPNQCILVRDEAARQRVREDMGLKKVGSVLSIYNSKGLEYDDILLYDFFEDSVVAANLWRHLLIACGTVGKSERHPIDLEDRRHSPLAVELKHLYVAITRARRNLWIVDTSTERCLPMKNYWTQGELVEEANEELTLAAFADVSATKDWLRRARDFFQRQIYDEAASAFERAGDERRARLADAFHAKRQASAIRERRQRRDALETAVDALLRCAAEAVEENEVQGIFSAIADVFLELKDYRRAADAFEHARKWSEAAEYYFKAGLLDQAVAVVMERKRNDIKSSVREKIVATAKCAYLEDAKERIGDARRLFEAEGGEDIDEFIDTHDFTDARVVVLEAQENYIEAAQVLFREGDVVGAMRLLVDNAAQQTCAERARALGFQYLRTHFSLASHTLLDRQVGHAQAIVEALDQLPPGLLTKKELCEIELFNAVLASDISTIRRFCQRSAGDKYDSTFAILCLDNYFSDISRIQVNDSDELLQFVGLFGHYVKALRALIMQPTLDQGVVDPVWLLGLTDVDTEYVDLGDCSLLGRAYRARYGPQASLRVTKAVAIDLKRSVLPFYLNRKIKEELSMAKRLSHFLEACWNQSVTGHCNSNHTHPVEHRIDQVWYNRRVRFHLEQICILHDGQSLPFVGDFPTRIRQRREWLSRLESILNPLFNANGSESVLDPTSIPELSLGLSVAKQWSLDVLYSLNPARFELQNGFLTHFIIAAKVGLRVDAWAGTHDLGRNLARVPCTWNFRRAHPGLFIRQPYSSPYAVAFLAEFLRGSGNVRDGVNFFELIVNRRIPLDLATLCDFADRLTGLFILTRAHEYNGVIHDVTLPRSWITELWSDIWRFTGRNAAFGARLVGALSRLLQDLYHDLVSVNRLYQLRIETTAGELPGTAARDVCMARICRDLCLVGYNFNNASLRESIVRDVTLLRTSSTPPGFVPLSRGYLFAESWTQLAWAVTGSCRRHLSDEMIQLCSLARYIVPMPLSQFVRQVTYRNLDDLPVKLEFRTPRVVMPDPVSTASALNYAMAATPQTTLASQALQLEPATQEHDGDSEPADGQDTTAQSVPPEEQDVDEALESKARIIQEAWHWRRVPSSGLFAAARHRKIREHRRLATSMAMTPTYRAVFIVHVPRLLLCLDRAITRAREEHANYKHQRKLAANNHALEEQVVLMNKVKEVGTMMNRANSLQAVLRPTSSIHSRLGALPELQQLAREAETLIGMLPCDTAMDAELKLALQGIENAGSRDYGAVKPKAAPKPQLNVDDL